jgi:hypothetical protein
MEEENNTSISSKESPLVSGTSAEDHMKAAPQAAESSRNVNLEAFNGPYGRVRKQTNVGEYSIRGGVISPTRTWSNSQATHENTKRTDAQLLSQLDAVEIDEPLLRIRPDGNTSFDNTQATGPRLVP